MHLIDISCYSFTVMVPLWMTSDIFLTKNMSGVDSFFPEPHLSYSPN